MGIQSEYSSTLNVLCGFRAFYTNYSGTRGAWGAWHGSPFIDEGDFCTGQTSQKLADLPGDLVYSGTGSYATRTNPVDGRTIMVYYSIGSYCNTQEFICFGNCYRTPEMLADPTFRVHNISAADPSSNPLRHVLYPSADPTVAPEAAQVSVIERFNATAYNGTISWQGTQGNITAVTYIQSAAQPDDAYIAPLARNCCAAHRCSLSLCLLVCTSSLLLLLLLQSLRACVGFGNPVCPAPANGSGNQTNASHPAQPQKLVDLRHKLMLRDE